MDDRSGRKQRLLVIGLDGYEVSFGDRMIAEGRLPNIARLKDESASFLLEHGAERFSGLAWEQLATGKSPRRGGRWSTVHFDTETYDVVQMQTEMAPCFGELSARTVVFDCPYFDLSRAPGVDGIVGWGAHDPGVRDASNPASLAQEIESRFGAFTGQKSLYPYTWPNAERTREMGQNLVDAVDQRAEVAEWLLSERFPNWDVALIVGGEMHSAVEAFWHGIDATHPLHTHDSAAPSAVAVGAIYEAVDRMLGRLTADFPDAAVLAFAMHGMGANDADVASMVLLPELLYRRQFGRSALIERDDWLSAELAPVGPDEDWSPMLAEQLPRPTSRRAEIGRRLRFRTEPRISPERRTKSISVEWIPVTRYRGCWPVMDAFAIPAYYHGRIRVNLRGRERRGRVAAAHYQRTLDELTEMLETCVNPLTGEPAVRRVDRFADGAPQDLAETDADLEVIWNGNPTAIEHPELGRIGPIPHRRTGGHTGPHGVAYLKSSATEPGPKGVRSAFDVAPTVFDLRSEPIPGDLSGKSLLA